MNQATEEWKDIPGWEGRYGDDSAIKAEHYYKEVIVAGRKLE